MILVIGYGNPLRSDDTLGPRIAVLLKDRFRGEPLEVLTVYQLTPELVEPVQQARLVVFIDARVGSTPGTIIHEFVEPEAGAGAFTHHVTPASLLGAARTLYGTNPAGILISIVGACFDYGGELSPQLTRRLPGMANQVEAIIRMNIGVTS